MFLPYKSFALFYVKNQHTLIKDKKTLSNLQIYYTSFSKCCKKQHNRYYVVSKEKR